jgi:drug/metabolite transporter (DMT)-like permease
MRLKSDLTLLLVAIVWGSGFVAQRLASSQTSVFWINGLRSLLGVLVLLPFIGFRLRLTRDQLPLILLAGCALFSGGTLQQIGLITTTASNAGFITGLYVVLVPILLAIFWKRRADPLTWIAAVVAAIGLGLLSTGGSFKLNPGDVFVLLGALAWAFHVILVGMAMKKVDFIPFAIGQYLVVTILNLLLGSVFTLKTFPITLPTWLAIAWLGIFSTGIGFTLQGAGQKHSPPADAAIILSMEAVFALVFGMIFLKEKLNWVQWVGCGLILAAMLLAQWKSLRNDRQQNPA